MKASQVLSMFLLTATAADAGDCVVHPVTLIEFEIVSCAPLDEANAKNVFQSLDLVRPWPSANDARARSFLDEQIATVVGEHDAIVIEAKNVRTRTIDVDSPRTRVTGPRAEPWKPVVEHRWLLQRTRGAGGCKRFTPNTTTVLAHPTECDCDSGKEGWCAVREESIVVDVHPRFTEFAR
jgi:hypothetical protein